MRTGGMRGKLRGRFIRPRRRLRTTRRRGAAVVEMAVVTPLLLMMVFGVMEFGWAFMIHETLTHATREAARQAMLPGATEAEIEQVFTQAMAPTGLSTAPQITYTDTDDPPDGTNETVTVTVVVPYEDVTITGLTGFLHINRQNLGASCTVRREGV